MSPKLCFQQGFLVHWTFITFETYFDVIKGVFMLLKFQMLYIQPLQTILYAPGM